MIFQREQIRTEKTKIQQRRIIIKRLEKESFNALILNVMFIYHILIGLIIIRRGHALTL